MATERKAQQVVEFHLASARDRNQSRFGIPIGMTTSINAFELFGWLINAPAAIEPQAVSVLKKVLKPFLIRPRVEYYDRGLDQSVLFESDIFNLVTITQGSRPTLALGVEWTPNYSSIRLMNESAQTDELSQSLDDATTSQPDPFEQLVTAPRLLELLWDESSRPCLRWLREQEKRKAIPSIRRGRHVWFIPRAVMQAMQTSFHKMPGKRGRPYKPITF